ncbi:unnamed protein product [Amoebophrya sp. A25]|nr:unnamed protein product [Amoebophrya sp. A25]|eukprot:GSA25T00000682001.1
MTNVLDMIPMLRWNSEAPPAVSFSTMWTMCAEASETDDVAAEEDVRHEAFHSSEDQDHEDSEDEDDGCGGGKEDGDADTRPGYVEHLSEILNPLRSASGPSAGRNNVQPETQHRNPSLVLKIPSKFYLIAEPLMWSARWNITITSFCVAKRFVDQMIRRRRRDPVSFVLGDERGIPNDETSGRRLCSLGNGYSVLVPPSTRSLEEKLEEDANTADVIAHHFYADEAYTGPDLRGRLFNFDAVGATDAPPPLCSLEQLPEVCMLRVLLFLPGRDWARLPAIGSPFFRQTAFRHIDLLAARISPKQLLPTRIDLVVAENEQTKCTTISTSPDHEHEDDASSNADEGFSCNRNFTEEKLLIHLERLADLEDCYVFDVFDHCSTGPGLPSFGPHREGAEFPDYRVWGPQQNTSSWATRNGDGDEGASPSLSFDGDEGGGQEQASPSSGSSSGPEKRKVLKSLKDTQSILRQSLPGRMHSMRRLQVESPGSQSLGAPLSPASSTTFDRAYWNVYRTWCSGPNWISASALMNNGGFGARRPSAEMRSCIETVPFFVPRNDCNNRKSPNQFDLSRICSSCAAPLLMRLPCMQFRFSHINGQQKRDKLTQLPQLSFVPRKIVIRFKIDVKNTSTLSTEHRRLRPPQAGPYFPNEQRTISWQDEREQQDPREHESPWDVTFEFSCSQSNDLVAAEPDRRSLALQVRLSNSSSCGQQEKQKCWNTRFLAGLQRRFAHSQHALSIAKKGAARVASTLSHAVSRCVKSSTGSSTFFQRMRTGTRRAASSSRYVTSEVAGNDINSATPIVPKIKKKEAALDLQIGDWILADVRRRQWRQASKGLSKSMRMGILKKDGGNMMTKDTSSGVANAIANANPYNTAIVQEKPRRDFSTPPEHGRSPNTSTLLIDCDQWQELTIFPLHANAMLNGHNVAALTCPGSCSGGVRSGLGGFEGESIFNSRATCGASSSSTSNFSMRSPNVGPVVLPTTDAEHFSPFADCSLKVLTVSGETGSPNQQVVLTVESIRYKD